jgi:ech hydrogenase subunit A
VVAATLLFPLISSVLIEPYVLAIYGATARMAQANVTIMLLMMALLLVLPISFMLFKRSAKHLPAYMGGRPATADRRFAGSLGLTREAQTRNYYLNDYFGEAKLFRPGLAVCTALIIISWILAGVAL